MLNLSQTTTVIKSIPWFLDLSHESITRLAAIAEVVSLEPGVTIFHEGDQHPHLFLIFEGKVRLESFVPGRGSLPFSFAEAFDVVGWSSLTPVVRQMTCTAIVESSTKMFKFPAQSLMACCESDCDLGFVIMRRLANIVASRLLTHRLQLLEIISCHK